MNKENNKAAKMLDKKEENIVWLSTAPIPRKFHISGCLPRKEQEYKLPWDQKQCVVLTKSTATFDMQPGS